MHKEFSDFIEHVGSTEYCMDNARASYEDPEYTLSGSLKLAPSSIEGLGIFAYENVEGCLGVFKDESWTYLGRYVNHSSTPNTYCYLENGSLHLRGKVKSGEELTVDYFQVKAMSDLQESIIVADDFCSDLDKVIASVRAAGFDTWLPNKGEVGSSVYDGMGFWGNHALMLKNIMPHMGSVIVPNSMFFRITKLGTEKAYIHSDRETGNWTCVAYLSEHTEPSGTAFFRHKPTGLIHMPSFLEMQEMGILDSLKEDMVSRDPDKWEQLGFIEGKFNRALIFKAPLFHSRYPVEGIGNTDEVGRLVWVSHFYKLDGYGQLS